jgi:hypothetical protein
MCRPSGLYSIHKLKGTLVAFRDLERLLLKAEQAFHPGKCIGLFLLRISSMQKRALTR